MDMHERTRLLIGKEGLSKLEKASVIVFGLGGVGGAATEFLCRAGVGAITVVDFDKVKGSNLNRQLIALRSTVGRPKAEVITERLREINPECEVTPIEGFFAPDTADEFDLQKFDYVLDCIDSLNPKVELIVRCTTLGVPLVVSTGAGGRIDPTGVRVSDLFTTRNCPLARHLRKRLRGRGVSGPIPAVHTDSPPLVSEPLEPKAEDFHRGRARNPIGSISYLPVIFGAVMAGHVVQELVRERKGENQ
jgi:tRNA A37 threonylcarbamoyladenosine dehydratase